MITAGDVQYEPSQQKVARVSNRVFLLIAGDYTAHSQAIKTTMQRARNNPQITPFDLAIAYGIALQGVRRRLAEDAILAPLGLNTDSFMAQQKDLSDHFIAATTDQLQNFQGPDVEAIVIGLDFANAGHLYGVDHLGTVRCYDDVGFTAIGIGGAHARLSLMQSGYVNARNLAPTLAAAFAAKKAAETAPGVGTYTDINVILRDGGFLLWTSVADHLERLYAEFSVERVKLENASILKLQEYLNELPKNSNPEGKSDETSSSQSGDALGTGIGKSVEDTTDGAV